jgi:hypothetical protein
MSQLCVLKFAQRFFGRLWQLLLQRGYLSGDARCQGKSGPDGHPQYQQYRYEQAPISVQRGSRFYEIGDAQKKGGHQDPCQNQKYYMKALKQQQHQQYRDGGNAYRFQYFAVEGIE